MNGGFTSSKAIAATVITIVTAVIGLALAAGLPISQQLQDAIIRFIEVTTPVAIIGYGWWHHNHAKIVAAREHSAAVVAAHQAKAAAPSRSRSR